MVEEQAELPPELPLVSVVIPTRNRPDDLAITLQQLRKQDYEHLEVIVIDDASNPPLEEVVTRHWPEAEYIRHPECRGQCAGRSLAFERARGKYIVNLDDDSCFTRIHELREAVGFLEGRSEIGILTFFVYNGKQLPENLQAEGEARYCVSYLAGGSVMRKEALATTGGYVEFFENHWEEEELSLRMLKAGWGIYYYPSVIIHHRVSPVSRRAGRTWMRGLRNQLWAQVMHLPAARLPIEIGWKLVMGFRDCVAYLMPHRFLQAVLLFLAGLPRAIRSRKGMDPLALRRYDALRFSVVLTASDYTSPPAIGAKEVWRWWTRVWWHRPRSRGFWDRGKGDLGKSSVTGYEHNYRSE